MEKLLGKSRQLAKEYLNKHLYQSAMFWAEKAALLSNGYLDDVVLFIQSLCAGGQHRRAIGYLQRSPLLEQNSSLRYLAAQCHGACEEWQEVLQLLQPPDTAESERPGEDVPSHLLGDVKVASKMLLGRAHEALGNMHEAVSCYTGALMEDVYCVEALEQLYQLYALSEEDEDSLMSSLPLDRKCLETEQMVRYLYSSKLRHQSKAKSLQLKPAPKICHQLERSVDVLSGQANQLLDMRDIDQCHRLTSDILDHDPYHTPTLLLHIACCVSQHSKKELFSLGHELVKFFPSSAIAWYAVGCYYLVGKDHPRAQKYFIKSLNIKPQFAPAHMAFGTSCVLDSQHDQAIAAFCNAARYMPSSHLPLCSLGREYFATGSHPTGTAFFKNALSLAPQDPFLLQEVGVVIAASGNYGKAEKYLSRAVSILQKLDPHATLKVWELVYNNLGHVLRKQEKLEEALKAHTRALQMNPTHPDTLAALGFVHLLQGDFRSSIEFCRHSLSVRREDLFVVEVMQMAVIESASVPLEFQPIDSLDQLVYEEEGSGHGMDYCSSSDSVMQTD